MILQCTQQNNMFVNIVLHVKQQHHPQAHRDGGMAKRNTTRDVMVMYHVRICVRDYENVMIHHMTQRCALIRIYREVEPLLCYGQERCFALKAWFVLVIKVRRRLLTTSASRP